MRIPTFTALVTMVCVAATPALAIPALNGKYTATGTEICQVAPNINKGMSYQHMGTMTLKSSTTGATGTYAQRVARGSLADRSTPMTAKSQTVAVTVTVSGSANPYTITVVGTVGTSKVTHTGSIQLDQVVSGVAQRATIVTIYKSGDTSTADCSLLMTLVHQ